MHLKYLFNFFRAKNKFPAHGAVIIFKSVSIKEQPQSLVLSSNRTSKDDFCCLVDKKGKCTVSRSRVYSRILLFERRIFGIPPDIGSRWRNRKIPRHNFSPPRNGWSARRINPQDGTAVVRKTFLSEKCKAFFGNAGFIFIVEHDNLPAMPSRSYA